MESASILFATTWPFAHNQHLSHQIAQGKFNTQIPRKEPHGQSLSAFLDA